MKDEIEFIRGGNDRVEKLLRKSDTYDESWRGLGKTPIEYFYRLGLLNVRTYGVHINYWEDNDLYYLAKSGLTPVFCPKSHNYFRHPRHPIADYLRVGLDVALGTDSLASNDSLSMIQEARLVVKDYPDVQLKDVFNSITVNGLKPLGLNARLGRLAPGKIADITVWDDIHGDSPDEVIHEIIMHREETLLTMVNGVVRHERHES
jgi:cytosine/adenosine deaminase-related metal-dependent hydrolase